MRIYHTSDLHDHRGIAQPLRALRAEAPGLLFDCGDSLRGSQTIYHRNEPIVAEIDQAQYDAQAIGNREFHYLFGCVRARASRMHHPLVCANLVDTKNRPLPFSRWLRLDHDGVRVNTIGFLVMQYPTGSPWERIFGWRFLEPAEVLKEYAQALPPEEPLVVLSHLGLRKDKELAQAVPRVDLILGGHSHDTLCEPEFAGGVPIVHAGPYGRFVSSTELSFDAPSSRWKVVSFGLRPLLV